MRTSGIGVREGAVPTCDPKIGFCDVPDEDLIIDIECRSFPQDLKTEWTEASINLLTGREVSGEELEEYYRLQYEWHEKQISEKRCHAFRGVLYCFCDER